MISKKNIGSTGEKLAAKYLEENGYKVRTMNFYCEYGEIDIIAEIENVIIFIEVKTRTNLLFGYPIEGINYDKKNHIKKTAKYYLYKNKIYNIEIRFDAIEVYLKNSKYKINHIKDIIN